MSIDAIMQTAISALQTYQAALKVTSDNVSNVNTPGYARREVHLDTVVVDSQPGGVEIGEIRRVVDAFLQTELINASAGAAYYEAQAVLHDRLQAVLGRPDSDITLNERVNDMFASFSGLAITPDDPARRLVAIEDLQSLATDIGRLRRADSKAPWRGRPSDQRRRRNRQRRPPADLRAEPADRPRAARRPRRLGVGGAARPGGRGDRRRHRHSRHRVE